MTAQIPEIQLTRLIPAPRQRVFEVWLDPKALATFIRPAPNMTVPTAECDARVGGEFFILMRAGDQDFPHRGEYRTIDRFDRLAFTWHSANAGTDSLVTLDFEPAANDHTRLTLRHGGLSTVKSRDDHEIGWTSILETLAPYCLS